jgi:transcriptional regulator with XRE-family HTH domain
MKAEFTEAEIEKIWNRIERERREQNLSQQELAKRAGIYPTVYSDIKTGLRKLSLRSAILLADVLGLEIQLRKKR